MEDKNYFVRERWKRRKKEGDEIRTGPRWVAEYILLYLGMFSFSFFVSN